MKKHTSMGMAKRVLMYSAPFLLISLAINLFALWGAAAFIEGSLLYSIVTMFPEKTDDTLLVLDEKDRESLKENNAGITIPEDFPIITIGEQWATITIEDADVDAVPVFHGDDENNLWKGVGHYTNSRFPGQHGKVVLSAHVGIEEYFQRLETLKPGAEVVLDTVYGKYVYKVTGTKIFSENDPSLLLPEAEDTGDKLICYTCYPFKTTGVRTQRFAIICELVSGKDFTASEEVTGE